MMGKEHYVKIAPEYFEAIDQGVKGFEIRFNDRNYKVGDILCLREYCDERYTGRELKREICYIVDDARFCKEGFVVLGITAKTTTNTCEECVHKKICHEIEGLRCRADFIWYKAEYGCPHYNNEADYRKQSEGVTDINVGSKSEWISVGERLPKEDTIVLVWLGEVAVFNYLSNDLWYTGYCDVTTSEAGITHWLPLPEAPKGGAE